MEKPREDNHPTPNNCTWVSLECGLDTLSRSQPDMEVLVGSDAEKFVPDTNLASKASGYFNTLLCGKPQSLSCELAPANR